MTKRLSILLLLELEPTSTNTYRPASYRKKQVNKYLKFKAAQLSETCY